MAITVFAELQRRYRERFAHSVLHTSQRRVRHWRALHGSEREIALPRSTGAAGPVGLHLRRRSGGPCRRRAARAPAVPVCFCVQRLAARARRPRRRELPALAAGLQDAIWMVGGVPEERAVPTVCRPPSTTRPNRKS